MLTSAKWIKKDKRNYALKDLNGNVLLELEDRTCHGNFITEEILQKHAQEYFEDQEKENEQ
jgi:hypothetical protein